MARVPLILSKDQVAPEHHATVDAIIGSRGALHGPFSVFLHSPEIAGPDEVREILELAA